MERKHWVSCALDEAEVLQEKIQGGQVIGLY